MQKNAPKTNEKNKIKHRERKKNNQYTSPLHLPIP